MLMSCQRKGLNFNLSDATEVSQSRNGLGIGDSKAQNGL